MVHKQFYHKIYIFFLMLLFCIYFIPFLKMILLLNWKKLLNSYILFEKLKFLERWCGDEKRKKSSYFAIILWSFNLWWHCSKCWKPRLYSWMWVCRTVSLALVFNKRDEPFAQSLFLINLLPQITLPYCHRFPSQYIKRSACFNSW